MSSPLAHVDLKLVQSMDDVAEFQRWLGQTREVLGVDTETGGFSPERNRLRMIQFGDYDTGWAIPWEQWGGIGIQVMKQYVGPMALHNSKFDSRFITRHGGIVWPWHQTEDTMAMAHIINPLRPKGLKPLAAREIDPKAAAMSSILDEGMSTNGWTWDTVPFEFKPYWIYGALDPVLTCHLYRKFKPLVPMNVYQLEMGATRIVAGMETRGVRVDLDYCDVQETRLNNWVRDAKDWIREVFGIDTPTDMQLMKWFNAQGIPMLDKTTPGGRQSFDKEVLGSIDHPLAETILHIRQAEKNVGPYYKRFRLLADENDRLHANVWTMGARTSRMSIDTPSLQNLPRKDPAVRGAFIPSEGGALVTCDYDQVEARLAAHFANDAGLIEAFGRDEDFFCAIASQVFNELISKKDERRTMLKSGIYGKLYGAGIEKIAMTLRVPVETMAAVMNTFDSAYPGIRRLQREINYKGKDRQIREGESYVETPTGRRMYSDDNKEYTLTNYLIQCHAAEILKRKMIELDAVGLGDYMILAVHDELVFDCPAEEAQDVARQVKEIMADLTNYRVPITASADVLTKNWGEKYR